MANMNKNNTNRGGLEANPSPWDITAEDLQEIDNSGEDEKKTALERLEESNLDPSILNSNALKYALSKEDINTFEVSADGKRLNFRGMVRENAKYGEMRDDNHPTGVDAENVLYGKGKMISRDRMVSDYSVVKRDDGGIGVIQTIRSNTSSMFYCESNNTLETEEVYSIGEDQKTYDKDGVVIDSRYTSHEPYRIESTKSYNGTRRHYFQDFHDFATDDRFAGQRMNDGDGAFGDHLWVEAQHAPVTQVVEMHRNENDKNLVTVQELFDGVWSTAINLPVDDRDDYELNPSGRNLMMYEDSFKENKDNKWVDIKDVADR